MSGELELPRHPVVLGAGVSGRSAAAALMVTGVEVVLVDDRHDHVEGAPCEVTAVDAPGLLADCDVLIKSPGVLPSHPLVAEARGRGIPVWSEVELGYRLLPPGARMIGVTGTNGKTTTTELVGAMLYEAALPYVVCGNIGVPLCDVAPHLPEGAIVVCELSSHQLEDIVSLRCDAAGIINITPDHLDWHGTLEAYERSKLRIFERQNRDDVAVVNADDPRSAALSRVPGDGVVVRVHGSAAAAAGFDGGRLRGDHNRQNVAVAAALARTVGVSEAAIIRAVEGFAPVEHRLEDCGTVDGVRYWNDSKATNVDAAVKALTAFPDERLRIILGGSEKGADFEPLAAALQGQIIRAYVTGPAGLRMLPVLRAAGIDAVHCDGFDAAVRCAAREAAVGEHVLLAPACASFDEFSDYSARGRRFRALVAHAQTAPG